MIMTRENDRSICAEAAHPAAPAEAPPPLVDLLAELVRRLGRHEGDPHAAGNEGTPERWHDKDFAYLEVELPESDGPEIDLNVHRGRVYIRVGR